MTSRCKYSVPRSIMALHSWARLAKSAERIEAEMIARGLMVAGEKGRKERRKDRMNEDLKHQQRVA